MPWVKLSDDFFDNLKIVRAGRDARDLYLAGLCFCGRQLTDGFIPEGQLPRLAADAGVEHAPELTAKLIAVGLWHVTEGGYAVHDYLDYNPTRDEALTVREARAEAGRLGGLRSADSKRQAKAQANAITNASANLNPVPVPVPVPLSRIPDPEPLQGGERRKETRQPRILFGEDTDAFKLATHLRDRILENKPNAKVPGRAPADLTVWAASIDLLLRIDKRASAEVRRVIDWCQADDFWKTNILSPPTLRRQYDQLEAKMLRAEANANGAAKRQEVNRGADPGESSPYATQGIVFDTDRKTVTYPGRA